VVRDKLADAGTIELDDPYTATLLLWVDVGESALWAACPKKDPTPGEIVKLAAMPNILNALVADKEAIYFAVATGTGAKIMRIPRTPQ
jgi:hypothetical protein